MALRDMMWSVLVAVLVFKTADSASSGVIGSGNGYCWNTKDVIGCDPRNFTDPSDHLTCSENGGIMWWVGKPVYTKAFTLKGPVGKTSYSPGEWILIELDVNIYTLKYRGLVLHASNATHDFLGEWIVAGDDGQTKLFWNPEPNCLMHAQADLKPLKMKLRYKAPPKDSGTIHFHAMLKVGPANDGWFYYANGMDLNLAGTVPPQGFPGRENPFQLTEGPPLACASQGMTCDETVLQSNATSTPNRMESTLSNYGCLLPYIADCGSVSPARTQNGKCYYNAADKNLCSDVTSPISRCDSMHDSASRFCPCAAGSSGISRLFNYKSQTKKAPFPIRDVIPVIPAQKVTQKAKKTHKASEDMDTTTMKLTPVSTALGFAGGMISALTLWTLRRQSMSSGLSVMLAMLALCQPVSAHNWLRSPGRAMFEASTTNPYRQRKATDIHAQLGPGQRMAVKFATGHSRDHYFSVVNGADESFIFDSQYKNWLDDYIALAPAGTNQASLYPRLHSCRTASNCNDPLYFNGQVMPGETDFCDHPVHPSPNGVFRWKSQYTASDQFLFYDSQKYPWIVGVIRYDNIVHQPSDWDVFCMPVPLKDPSKGNHHIVHWIWRGYYDAIDVHALPTAVPEELIYGNDTGKTRITKVDHCQYIQPRKLTTPLLDATHNMTDCLQALENSATNSNPGLPQLGMSVVPLENPSGVAISNVYNLPLNYTSDLLYQDIKWPRDYLNIALDSPLMRLQGTVTRGGMDWSTWFSGVTKTANHRCERWWGNDTLEHMLTLMTAESNDYFAIMWLHEGKADSEFYGNNPGRIYPCRRFRGSTPATTLIPDTRYHVFQLPSDEDISTITNYVDPATWTDGNHLSFKVSFQPADPRVSGNSFTIDAGTGWSVDTGEVYSAVRGYGWRCQQQMAVETRRPRIPDTSNTNRSVGRTSNIHIPCSDGKLNSWEIDVPNGAYIVTLFPARGTMSGLGCVMENTRISRNSFREQVVAKTIGVEVKDGRFTLSQTGHYTINSQDNTRAFNRCPNIHWIKLDRLADRLPRAHVPNSGSNEAWWQMAFSQSEQVGAVTIELPRAVVYTYQSIPRWSHGYYISCANRWFYEQGASCFKTRRLSPYGDGSYKNEWDEPDIYQRVAAGSNTVTMSSNTLEYQQPWGVYDVASNPNVGAVVSISDIPCTNAGGCPTSNEKVCEVISQTDYCEDQAQQHRECLIRIDCRGETGSYLRIRLRGQQRTLAIYRVKVHRPVPRPQDMKTPTSTAKSKMLCYGLEPRIATETAPGFITTEDPSDPIFYSTCFARSRDVEWLPLPSASALPPQDWRFNGECLSCTSFAENGPSIPISQNITPQWWLESNTCQNCFGDPATWGVGKIDGPTPNPTPSPTPPAPTTPIPTTPNDNSDNKENGESLGTVMIVGVALVGVLVPAAAGIGYMCWKRRSTKAKVNTKKLSQYANRKSEIMTMEVAAKEGELSFEHSHSYI
ncbi:hypothetical protein AAMO2058_000758800 [Amorphochlora amoebiformis]